MLLTCLLITLGAESPHTTAHYILKYSLAYNIHPLVVTSVALHESRLRHRGIVSSTKDYGVMQINKIWRKEECPNRKRNCLLSLRDNIRIGIKALRRARSYCRREKPEEKLLICTIGKYNPGSSFYSHRVIRKLLRVITLYAKCQRRII